MQRRLQLRHAPSYSLISRSAQILVVVTWVECLQGYSKLGLFTFHPMLQTLSVALFGYGIMLLQRTGFHDTRGKARGLSRHQLVMLGAALPLLAAGTGVIVANKIIHGKNHITSWHAVCDYIRSTLSTLTILICPDIWIGGVGVAGRIVPRSKKRRSLIGG